ncbi:MAG: phosphopantetheine-binding protein [Clostridiales bacterium]|nr:phosphopantetheine-binding protein [Clostridiales bacterium]MDY3746783.1 phosphopantetheine-binding protein [Lachnospiraceae bacterium]
MEFEKVRSILAARLLVPVGEITPETEFSKDLGMDSIEMLGLIIEIEKEFEIVLDMESIGHLNTVADAVDYIRLRIDSNRGMNQK